MQVVSYALVAVCAFGAVSCSAGREAGSPEQQTNGEGEARSGGDAVPDARHLPNSRPTEREKPDPAATQC